VFRDGPALVAAAALVWTIGTAGQESAGARTRLAAVVAPVIDAIWTGYDTRAAMGHVEFIGSRWRLPGNPSYNASIDRIRDRLVSAGLTPTIEEYPNGGPAWDYAVGTLALVTPGKPDEIVTSRDLDHISLCANSFSTAPGGVVARLVDVGRGTDQDYAGKDIKGAVVLGDQAPNQLWTRAVVNGGAIGIVSASPPARYISPDAPGAPATPPDQWNVFQWTNVPYDAARKAFGFKASARTATTLRKRIQAAAGEPVSVHVTIDSTFSTGPVRTLSIEIPGRTAPGERIVMAAHVQEPGANDNASGVATLAETVVSLAGAIKQKKVPQPERTLTFLFLTEISGSRQWLRDHADAAKQVKYMFSLDMTGEDVKKTGGSFLVERYPDPGAVWDRPWDPHTEWGRGNVRVDSLKGDLLNDTHWFVLEQVARKTGWVIHSNPYEGGSDHTVFQGVGIPSVLDWHFTDRYYHSNLDTPDKTSPEEMRNVGVGVGASAWLLASATPAIATDVANLVASAGKDRIDLETREGAKIAAAAPDRKAADEREATILAAWRKWYAEAVRSTSRLVIGTAPASLTAEIERLAKTFEAASPSSGGVGGAGFSFPALAWLGLGTATPQSVNAKPDQTMFFVCGKDHVLPEPIPVTGPNVVVAGDGRLYKPCPGDPPADKHPEDHRESREAALIRQGLLSSDTEVRWRAAQAFARNSHLQEIIVAPLSNPSGSVAGASLALIDGLGGFMAGPGFVSACRTEVQLFDSTTEPKRWQPGRLFFLLTDAPPTVAVRAGARPATVNNTRVRREAAYAIGARLAQPGLDEMLVTAATRELQACFRLMPDIANLILEDIGVARYERDDQIREAEAFLVATTGGAQAYGGAKGLEALYRQHGQYPASQGALMLLRQLARHGTVVEADARVRRLALMALQAARDHDTATLRAATTDSDFQVRRLVAGSLNLSDPEHARLGEILETDESFQVRYELLAAVTRLVRQTHQCAPFVERFKDLSPAVVMRAMDLLQATCTDLDETIAKLIVFSDKLLKEDGAYDWHVSARALAALARVKPDMAHERIAAAAKHLIWQVRAAVAAATVDSGDAAVASVLARDAEPNVQTAALDALFRMRSPDVVPAAIAVLDKGEDYQALRMAAMVLKGLPAEARTESSDALLQALRRLTDHESDTSRDPRVAIIERLAETLDAGRSFVLLPFATDFDDQVNAAVAKTLNAIGSGVPGLGSNKRRYPYQPEPDVFSNGLPQMAVIELEEGTVTITLLTDVAPVTVARFVQLVNRGYYAGLTFHRVVPNFVVQGGSPGANEYAGTSRYMRDEVGPQGVHVRGAVGISTRGGDTGDGQIFIDLVDLPRLDRDYTVFGYVTIGIELVDRLLEGAKIKGVSVK
jgi:cyclophilin family peptidyl-prolyl cis-trans isomerase/Zn-dependent M28 family amino/carboxypeptidase